MGTIPGPRGTKGIVDIYTLNPGRLIEICQKSEEDENKNKTETDVHDNDKEEESEDDDEETAEERRIEELEEEERIVEQELEDDKVRVLRKISFLYEANGVTIKPCIK